MSRTEQLLEDEAGIALVYTLLVAIILGGLAVVFAARAMTESRVTGGQQKFETAVHVAEAGVDKLIAELNKDFTKTSSFGSPKVDHVYDLASSASEAEQRQWAIDVANTACDLVPTAVGEACAIRPRLGSSSGAPAPFMFGVGFTPNRAGAVKTRVVKLGITNGRFVPAKAVLTRGEVSELNITICGQHRDVHSNGTILVKGGADTVTPGTKTNDGCPETASGKVTSAGAFTRDGNPDIDPASGRTGHTVHVPSVSAIEVYKKYLDPGSEHYNTTYAAKWNTLCPDGTVRRPYFNPSGEPEPCSTNAPKLYPTTTPAPSTYMGWRLTTLSTGISCNPCWNAGGGNNAAALQDGIFYAYQQNAVVSGSIGRDVRLTILADAVGTIVPYEYPDTGTGRSCSQTGSANGNIGVFGVGGGSARPFMDGQLLIADRDVKMGGNMSSPIHGLIAAHEQVELAGQPQIVGAVVAEDACPNSTGSPVTKNLISGSFSVTHTKDSVSALTDVVQITAWNEY